MWNKAKVLNVFGPSRLIKGNARENGFNISISSYVFNKHASAIRNLYVTMGYGSSQTTFDIYRPFFYPSPVFIVYYVNAYDYKCVDLFAGAGYSRALGKKYKLKGAMTFTSSKIHKQIYYTDGYPAFTSHITRQFSTSLLCSIGFYRCIGKKFELGTLAVVPAFISWNKDQIFDEDGKDTFLAGTGIGINMMLTYKFN